MELNDINIDLVQAALEILDDPSPESIEKTYISLIHLISKKDEVIQNMNIKIQHQSRIIIHQINEIAQLHNDINTLGFYKAHPKDNYNIGFGHATWRTFTFRNAISLKNGEKICNWILKKKSSDSKAIEEFRKYLTDINYNLESYNFINAILE